MVPYKLKASLPERQTIGNPPPQFDPETVHVCTKLSGEAAQFSKKAKFDSIVRVLSARCKLFQSWRISFSCCVANKKLSGNT